MTVIRGRVTPDPMAVEKAMKFRVQLVVSAYLKIRCQPLEQSIGDTGNTDQIILEAPSVLLGVGIVRGVGYVQFSVSDRGVCRILLFFHTKGAVRGRSQDNSTSLHLD